MDGRGGSLAQTRCQIVVFFFFTTTFARWSAEGAVHSARVCNADNLQVSPQRGTRVRARCCCYGVWGSCVLSLRCCCGSSVPTSVSVGRDRVVVFA